MSNAFLAFTLAMCLTGAFITAYVGPFHGLLTWVAVLVVLGVVAAAAFKRGGNGAGT